jgi:hypothetical protein
MEGNMILAKKSLALPTVFGIRNNVNTQPDYQRPAVWSTNQKRLLIDTILRNYDIPKMYWRQIGQKPDKYEVVDGQQRLRAIWEFMNNEYNFGKDAEPIDDIEIKNLTYNTLPLDLRNIFDQYNLDIMVMVNTDEEEVREMFLRLQNGSSLKAQERRNAMSGNMRDFVKQISVHKFFENCKHENTRYTYDLVAAQIVRLELAGQPCNIKNADLNKMYNENKDFDINGPKAKKARKVLDYLYKCFPKKTPELEWYSVISLYMIISYLSRFQNSVSFGPTLGKTGLKPDFSLKSKVAVPKSDILELPPLILIITTYESDKQTKDIESIVDKVFS